MPLRILMVGTFDTKATEYAFLRERLLEHGCEVIAMNAGVDGTTTLSPIEIEAEHVATAGGAELAELNNLWSSNRIRRRRAASAPRSSP